jgi:DNA-binding protein Fis
LNVFNKRQLSEIEKINKAGWSSKLSKELEKSVKNWIESLNGDEFWKLYEFMSNPSNTKLDDTIINKLKQNIWNKSELKDNVIKKIKEKAKIPNNLPLNTVIWTSWVTEIWDEQQNSKQ